MLSKFIKGTALAAGLASPHAATARDAFVGEMMMFAGNFCPRGWIPATGGVRAASRMPEIFDAVGDRFGGDGETTFGLPDLRGREPRGTGEGPGLGAYSLGDEGGRETARLTPENVSHTHRIVTGSQTGGDQGMLARKGAGGGKVPTATAGEAAPFDVRDPRLGITICVASVGWPVVPKPKPVAEAAEPDAAALEEALMLYLEGEEQDAVRLYQETVEGSTFEEAIRWFETN